MDEWGKKTISPTPERAPKVDIRYPCPGLCRLAGVISFMVSSLGVYYGGMALLGLEPLNWEAPAWTAKYVGLIATASLIGMLSSVSAFTYTMTIEVRSERLNDFFIILWQFLATGSMLWFFVIGIAMSISLGREGAKAAVLHFGAERATVHVIVTGSGLSSLLGLAFFLALTIRLPSIIYLAFSEAVSLFAARWHFLVYGIDGNSWIVAGLITPILLLVLTPSMIERDRRQRRLVIEQSP